MFPTEFLVAAFCNGAAGVGADRARHVGCGAEHTTAGSWPSGAPGREVQERGPHPGWVLLKARTDGGGRAG